MIKACRVLYSKFEPDHLKGFLIAAGSDSLQTLLLTYWGSFIKVIIHNFFHGWLVRQSCFHFLKFRSTFKWGFELII
jgi:hypothetical protein